MQLFFRSHAMYLKNIAFFVLALELIERCVTTACHLYPARLWRERNMFTVTYNSVDVSCKLYEYITRFEGLKFWILSIKCIQPFKYQLYLICRALRMCRSTKFCIKCVAIDTKFTSTPQSTTGQWAAPLIDCIVKYSW